MLPSPDPGVSRAGGRLDTSGEQPIQPKISAPKKRLNRAWRVMRRGRDARDQQGPPKREYVREDLFDY
jgi:hypothetical protein